MKHYILNGTEVVAVDMMTWAVWFQKAERIVAKSDVADGIIVSTVFLGMDHSFMGGPPLVFETMCFGPNGEIGDAPFDRYSTWREAEIGHMKAVKELSEKLRLT